MNLQFVLSPDFHGTTPFALLLNNHRRISALGDGNPFQPFDGICPCGRTVRDCAFWGEARRRIDTHGFRDQSRLLPLYPDILGLVRADAFLSKMLSLLDAYLNLPVWGGPRSSFLKYSRVYLDFHRAVCDIHGTDVFVSGSKNLTEVLVQRRFAEDVDRIRVIHLARDPRGYVYSAGKHYGHSVRKATRTWNLWHGAFRRLQGRSPGIESLFVRYEDFCREPQPTMDRVFSFLGVEPQAVCHAPDDLRKQHILGHDIVFDGIIREAESWKRDLTRGQQRDILARTRPLSEAFGYILDLDVGSAQGPVRGDE